MLAPAIATDLSDIRTWPDFAALLDRIHKRSGLTLSQLEELGRTGELKRGTVSDALSGTRKVSRGLLDSLLAAWQLPEFERDQVIGAWQRLFAGVGLGPANACRFYEASPRELGIHAAIITDDTQDDLPSYVRRDFADRLERIIANGAGAGCFVVLVGRSSTGKTRSLYEAVSNSVPDWWLVQPSKTQEIVDLCDPPPEKTIVWLDEIHRFLGTEPPLTKAMVLTLVRAGAIVVGTLWPDEYTARKPLRRTDGPDTYADDRVLLDFAEIVNVDDALSTTEQGIAVDVSQYDDRIRVALESTDAGLTQVLAAGPDMVRWWQHAPNPYAKAIISAAADARRLGVDAPLSAELLKEAMVGYLTPAQRVTPPSSWLDSALPHATEKLHGAVSALTAVAGAEAGIVAGYVAADYLAQHVRRIWRTECPPHSLWNALLSRMPPGDDLRRLATSAQARMRYEYAKWALEKMVRENDVAAAEFVTILVRQNNFDEAIATLRRKMIKSQTKQLRMQETEVLALQERADRLRGTNDDDVRDRLTELLADRGEADDLRIRADAGDAVAADRLADLLADRGCLRELRQRADGGHQFAAERLADFLVAQRRAGELRRRAKAGDRVSELRLAKLDGSPAAHGSSSDEGVAAELSQLRTNADAGDEQSASQLTSLLFDLRQRDELFGEVNAGTYQAADRYVALLVAEEDMDRGDIRQIRAFGLNADGSIVRPGERP